MEEWVERNFQPAWLISLITGGRVVAKVEASAAAAAESEVCEKEAERRFRCGEFDALEELETDLLAEVSSLFVGWFIYYESYAEMLGLPEGCSLCKLMHQILSNQMNIPHSNR